MFSRNFVQLQSSSAWLFGRSRHAPPQQDRPKIVRRTTVDDLDSFGYPLFAQKDRQARGDARRMIAAFNQVKRGRTFPSR